MPQQQYWSDRVALHRDYVPYVNEVLTCDGIYLSAFYHPIEIVPAKERFF